MISIIIPFYNVASYLERAILSALGQDYKDIEVILVDDGSTDDSGNIAKRFNSQNENVILLTSKNLGPGNARNLGLIEAKGEFVVFLDGDDALEPFAVSLLYDCMLQTKSDIVISKFTMYDMQNKYLRKGGWNSERKVIKGCTAAKEMYTGGIASVVWAKMYRSKVIDTINFPTGLWFEDRPYLLECFLKADKVSFVNQSLFKIFSREDSITRKVISKKRIKDLHLIFELEMKIVSDHEDRNLMSAILIGHHIDVLLDTFFLLLIDRNRIDDFDDLINYYRDYIKKFINHNAFHTRFISVKKNIVLLFLRTVLWMPWKVMSFGGSVVFRKKYKGIRLLKT